MPLSFMVNLDKMFLKILGNVKSSQSEWSFEIYSVKPYIWLRNPPRSYVNIFRVYRVHIFIAIFTLEENKF